MAISALGPGFSAQFAVSKSNTASVSTPAKTELSRSPGLQSSTTTGKSSADTLPALPPIQTTKEGRDPAFNLKTNRFQAESNSPSATDSDKGQAEESKESQESQSKREPAKKTDGQTELSEEEQREVTRLKSRDAEVVAHENAHLAAAGPYARGGAQYSYTTGPDGRRYRTGGSVNIDMSEEPKPEATIQKAQVIYRAALAPAQPSNQDRSVAQAAKQMENRAREELRDGQQISGYEGNGTGLDAVNNITKSQETRLKESIRQVQEAISNYARNNATPPIGRLAGFLFSVAA